MRQCRWLLIVILAFASPLAPRRASAAPATQPENQALIDQTLAAINNNSMDAWEQSLEQQATTALGNGKTYDLKKVVELATFRQFAYRFRQTGDMSEFALAAMKWLVKQPRLMPTLMAAMSGKDDPQDLLSLLNNMHQELGDQLEAYPDLATALLVVWDKPLDAGPDSRPHAPKADAATAIHLFHYFVNMQRQMRFSPRNLPWQLAVYMVDVKVGEPEMLWALNRYGRTTGSIGGVYFDVPYDFNAYLTGGARKIDAHDYTLPNLVQYGGICVDQAYFATQVAKVMGIPSCICVGQAGAGGMGHAWVGVLEQDGRQAYWNFDSGRYKEDLFWEAEITDPQTGEKLTDADVGLLAKLQFSDPPSRLASPLLASLADLQPPAQRVDIDKRAIELSPGNRQAWLALAQLAHDQQLSASEKEQVAQVVAKYLLQQYPDFACAMLMMMVNGSVQQQVDALDRIINFFPSRPDLRARIRIQQAQVLSQSGRDDDAMLAYGDVLTRNLNAGPIILQAMQAVEQIMRQRKDLVRLEKIDAQVWTHMSAPSPSPYAAYTPYCQLGKRYADLLDELGQTNLAASVRERLRELVKAQNSTP